MRCSANSGEHLAIAEVARKDFWSYYEAAQRDRLAGKINGVDSLVHVACAADAGGRAFRRYVLPIRLYALDMIQDGFAMPGQINASTRAGRHFKVGLIELIDALIAHPTIEGVLELARRARDESAADPNLLELLDIDGMCGPRIGRPNLWREFQKRNLTRLLGYGRYYRTPVAELDLESGSYRGCGTVLFSAAGGGMSGRHTELFCQPRRPTLGTRRLFVTTNQQLEIAPAALACVFVDRHRFVLPGRDLIP